MQLETGKKKEFSVILSKSGNGKTVLEFFLIKAKQMPTLIVDNYNQFKGAHKSLKQLTAYFLDFENVEDFKTYNRQILVKLKPNEAGEFYEYLLNSRFLAGSLIVNDEIDLTLGTSNVQPAHPFYQFCNRGRHLEYKFIATARATQNIPKVLTQQTDIYYIGRVQNKPMLEYLESNTNIKNIDKITAELEEYQYIRYNTSTEDTHKFKIDFGLMSVFDDTI